MCVNVCVFVCDVLCVGACFVFVSLSGVVCAFECVCVGCKVSVCVVCDLTCDVPWVDFFFWCVLCLCVMLHGLNSFFCVCCVCL